MKMSFSTSLEKSEIISALAALATAPPRLSKQTSAPRLFFAPFVTKKKNFGRLFNR